MSEPTYAELQAMLGQDREFIAKLYRHVLKMNNEAKKLTERCRFQYTFDVNEIRELHALASLDFAEIGAEVKPKYEFSQPKNGTFSIEIHRNGEVFRFTMAPGTILHVRDGDKVFSVGS